VDEFAKILTINPSLKVAGAGLFLLAVRVKLI